MADIFDQVGAKPAGKPAPAGDIFDQVSASPAAGGGDIFDQVSAQLSPAVQHPDAIAQQTTAAAQETATQSILRMLPHIAPPQPQQPGILDRVLAPFTHGGVAQQLDRISGPAPHLKPSRKEQATPPPDFNTPAVDFTQWTPQPGAMRGAAEFASGLTSPTSVALTALPAGITALTKGLGKGLVSRLLSAGFSALQVHEAIQETPKLRDAWQKQDWPVIRQSLTRMALSAGGAGLAAKHALTKSAAAPKPIPAEETKPDVHVEQPTESRGQPQKVEQHVQPQGAAGEAQPAAGRPEGSAQQSVEPAANGQRELLEPHDASPPKEGFTRLYRVDSSKAHTKGVPSWMEGSPDYDRIKSATGRWFAADPHELPFYLKDSDPGAVIKHVDVPTQDVEAYRVSNQPNEIKKFSGRPDKEFFVPPSVAEARRPTHPDALPDAVKQAYLPVDKEGKHVYPEEFRAKPAPIEQPEPAKPEPAAAAAEEHAAPERPAPPAEHQASLYFGSGLGALEPLFRESKAEGDALLAKRNAALAAAKAAADTPEQKKAGEAVRSYFTSERDLWAARANQAIRVVTDKVLPKIENREAIAIMREFRHRPGELQQFIDGSHPFFEKVNGGAAQATKNLERLMPRMREALSLLSKPMNDRQSTTDRLFTNIAAKSLQEGRAGGFMDSRWRPDEYVPHLLNEKGKGEVATEPSNSGKQMGKIGSFLGFAEKRSDKYPTLVHAVADGLVPKTLDPSAAFTVHADQFARARATHLLETHLADLGLGKWGEGKHVPEGWVQLAAHTDEFKKQFAYEDRGTQDVTTGEPNALRVGTLGLYVPPFIEKALSPITSPDYTAKLPGFAQLRVAQRGLKEAILGLSGFHLLTENMMAAADVGAAGMFRAFRTPLDSPDMLRNERELIASGGTTSVQGSTMDAYRNLRPGTIPTRAEVVRAYIPGSKQALSLADAITRFTFDNVQRRFKVTAFQLHRDAWLHDNPHATPEQFAAAKQGIASYVNGVYGGLHWENMGIPKALVEVSRAAFLAPDWSGSNIALAKYAADAKPSLKEFGFGLFDSKQMAGALTKETAQARLARAFWLKQLIGGLAATQMLSLMFSGQLSPSPVKVYLGKDKSGRDIFQNVAFRGSAGDLVNLLTKMEDHGLLTGFGNFVGSKAAPITKFGMHVITGLDDRGREIAPKDLSPIANTARSAISLGGDLLPIPITARTLQKTVMGDTSDKYIWSERMLSLFGPMAQHVSPEGTRLVNGELQLSPYREPHSILEQIRTGKP